MLMEVAFSPEHLAMRVNLSLRLLHPDERAMIIAVLLLMKKPMTSRKCILLFLGYLELLHLND